MTDRTPLTVTEAARLAGVSRRTVLRAIDIGDLAAIKTGDGTAAWIIRRASFTRWLAKRGT